MYVCARLSRFSSAILILFSLFLESESVSHVIIICFVSVICVYHIKELICYFFSSYVNNKKFREFRQIFQFHDLIFFFTKLLWWSKIVQNIISVISRSICVNISVSKYQSLRNLKLVQISQNTVLRSSSHDGLFCVSKNSYLFFIIEFQLFWS